jgi:hypothetical protein
MTPAASTRGGAQSSFASLYREVSSYLLEHAVLVNWLLYLAVAYVALISLPDAPRSYGTGLDPSWILGLNLAHAQGLIAGRDIVFTYGPLGYLLYPEPAGGASVLALIFRLGIHFAFVAGLCRLVWVMQSNAAAFWTVVILGLGAVLEPLPEENQFILAITVLALLTLADRSQKRYAELLLLGFAAGFGLLVKLNQGIEAGVIFLAVWAAVGFQEKPLTVSVRRRFLLALCILPLSLILLFAVSTGSLLGLGSYLRYAWETVSGYSEAMELAGPLWQAALASASIAAAFASVLLVADDLRSLMPGFAPALFAAFFTFKHAIVRQGVGHAPSFQVKFAVALLFLLVLARPARDRRLILVMQLFSLVVGYAIVTESHPGFDSDFRAHLQLRKMYASAEALWHWRATWAGLATANQNRRSGLRLPASFQQIIGRGTVDAIPWEVDQIEANGWKWRPRPAFQSYSAYTPALDQLNAGFLEGDRAADFVVLNFATIDGRHPFLETPLSWRALLDRYDLKLAGDWLLLQHRKTSRYEPPVSIGTSMAHWDEDVLVPRHDGLLLISPHMRPSLRGKAISVLFRSTPVYMEATLNTGKRERWRSVPANLSAGFLIHPFPQDLQELRSLFLPDPFRGSTKQVTSLRFHTDKPGEFDSEIPIEWSWLLASSVEPQDVPQRPLPNVSLTPLWRPKDRQPVPFQALAWANPYWVEVTPTTDDPQLLFDLGANLGSFPTLIIRARFEKADRIDAFFGKQAGGRGISGIVPAANQWLDVYLNMSHNVFWANEHGTTLRFDPVSSAGPGTKAYIAGIWGSTLETPPAWPDIEFYPVSPAQVPKGWPSHR